MGMLPYVTGYRAGYKAAKAADGPGGSGYDAAYRTGMQVNIIVTKCFLYFLNIYKECSMQAGMLAVQNKLSFLDR